MIEEWRGERKVYSGVQESDVFSTEFFTPVPDQFEYDRQWYFFTNLGSITVLDRMTGFGHRDIETGYRDPDGRFWLASSHVDVRRSGCKTIGDAISWIKEMANTCIPDRDEPNA